MDGVKEDLWFLEKKGDASTPEEFVNESEFLMVEEFDRNMVEEWEVG
ncbi:hypothetical protein [Siminovitchia fortis]|nr:hypothetical protein [Siminovitchia fortis]